MALIIVALQSQSPAFGQPAAWVPIAQGLDQARLQLVAVDPGDAHHVYAGSDRLLYRSLDGGRQWQVCFRGSLKTQLRDLAVDPFDAQHVVLATTEGVYASDDGGHRWQRVFRGIGARQSSCQVVRFHPLQQDQLWIGTARGLFQSLDGGKHWQLVSVSLPQHSVTDVAVDPRSPDRLYALTEGGLWARTQKPDGWTQLFSAMTQEAVGSDTDDAVPEEDLSEPLTLRQLTAVALDPQDPDHLYLASTQGVFVSQDVGQTWQRVTQLGLGQDEIAHLILHASSVLVVYAATPKGVARYRSDADRWETLYAGLPTQAVHRLAASHSKVFAATDRGLYSLDLTEELLTQGQWPSPGEILGNFVHEPTIGQVQQAAIHYAEVEPEKIQRWRRQAYLRAFVPTFNLTTNTEMGDFRHWDDKGVNGQDVLLKGERDLDWAGSLNWDLGDLIWSTDQTSIDVRSKLMVELRDEVISDVTRTFFERRRLQVELLTDPPSDPKTQLNKELRLQELTALLDGFTGGWFSAQLRPDSP